MLQSTSLPYSSPEHTTNILYKTGVTGLSRVRNFGASTRLAQVTAETYSSYVDKGAQRVTQPGAKRTT